jgi:N-ethylmaleimide reductase
MPIAFRYTRASAGLIITEGTNISPQGRGYAFTPGIYDDAQVEGWRQVTEAVHASGGRIFPQLWHVGRVSHPSLQPGGVLPVAPSAICPEATSYTEAGFQPCVTPRALATAEIPEIVEQYRRATRKRPRRRFRRRRDPCGQRLPHRAIPAR